MPDTQRRNGGELLEVAAILAVWAAAIAVIDPRGNFPAGDDWDFAIATWNFARTGHFHFTQFTAVSLRAQVVWGALWVRAFGESFEVLRASTLVLSAGTLVFVNRTLRHAAIARPVRIAATLALLAHPVFLWASCTFMTDVPFVFCSAAALYFFVRALDEDRTGFTVAGTAAVTVSWFIRQNGVINLVAALAVLLVARERLTPRWRRHAAIAGTGIVVFAAIFFARREWLAGAPQMFATHYHVWQESSFRLPEQLAAFWRYMVSNALNCAMFFLPLSLALLASLSKRMSRWSSVALAGLAVIVAWRVIELARNGFWMPYTTHTLTLEVFPGAVVFDFGIGPSFLYDTFSNGYDYPFRLAPAAAAILTTIVSIAAVVMLWALARASLRALRDPRQHVLLLLALAFAGAGSAALFASGYYFDRYSLDAAWALVIALPLIVPWQRLAARTLFAVGMIALATFSILGVQEFFALSRARWDAFASLRAQGIAVDRIEGGGEAYGLYELANADRKKERRGHPPREFAITLHAMPGYSVIARRPFSGFLGSRTGVVFTLRRG